MALPPDMGVAALLLLAAGGSAGTALLLLAAAAAAAAGAEVEASVPACIHTRRQAADVNTQPTVQPTIEP